MQEPPIPPASITDPAPGSGVPDTISDAITTSDALPTTDPGAVTPVAKSRPSAASADPSKRPSWSRRSSAKRSRPATRPSLPKKTRVTRDPGTRTKSDAKDPESRDATKIAPAQAKQVQETQYSCPKDIDRFLKTKAGKKLDVDTRCLQDRKYRRTIYKQIVAARKKQIKTKAEYLETIKKSNPPTSLVGGVKDYVLTIFLGEN